MITLLVHPNGKANSGSKGEDSAKCETCKVLVTDTNFPQTLEQLGEGLNKVHQ